MPNRKQRLEGDLQKWLSGAERVVVAGIGNPIRKDDFVGVKIAQDLQGKISERVMLIECETVPENYIQQIIDFKPTHVLLIDAAVLGLKTGEARLADPEGLSTFPAYSTHILPLQLFYEQVAEATKGKVGILLLQPETADFGEGLSPDVEKAAHHIVGMLHKVLP